MKKYKMSEYEAIELARAILTLEDDAEDEEVERELWRSFGTGLEEFKDIAAALLPLAMVAESPLTGTPYRGFAKDGYFIVKQEVG